MDNLLTHPLDLASVWLESVSDDDFLEHFDRLEDLGGPTVQEFTNDLQLAMVSSLVSGTEVEYVKASPLHEYIMVFKHVYSSALDSKYIMCNIRYQTFASASENTVGKAGNDDNYALAA